MQFQISRQYSRLLLTSAGIVFLCSLVVWVFKDLNFWRHCAAVSAVKSINLRSMDNHFSKKLFKEVMSHPFSFHIMSNESVNLKPCKTRGEGSVITFALRMYSLHLFINVLAWGMGIFSFDCAGQSVVISQASVHIS